MVTMFTGAGGRRSQDRHALAVLDDQHGDRQGTTSSIIACSDHWGAWNTGAAIHPWVGLPGGESSRQRDHHGPDHQRPDDRRQPPAQRGPGAEQQEQRHHRPGDQHSSRSARMRLVPNRRKTPATIAITIGIGMAAIARRTQPLRPKPRMSRPGGVERTYHLGEREVAQRGADQDGAGDGPEERKRLAVEPAGKIVRNPLMKKTPKTHDASSACDRPPCTPTARITATGPVAAKMSPIRPLAA